MNNHTILTKRQIIVTRSFCLRCFTIFCLNKLILSTGGAVVYISWWLSVHYRISSHLDHTVNRPYLVTNCCSSSTSMMSTSNVYPQPPILSSQGHDHNITDNNIFKNFKTAIQFFRLFGCFPDLGDIQPKLLSVLYKLYRWFIVIYAAITLIVSVGYSISGTGDKWLEEKSIAKNMLFVTFSSNCLLSWLATVHLEALAGRLVAVFELWQSILHSRLNVITQHRFLHRFTLFLIAAEIAYIAVVIGLASAYDVFHDQLSVIPSKILRDKIPAAVVFVLNLASETYWNFLSITTSLTFIFCAVAVSKVRTSVFINTCNLYNRLFIWFYLLI